MNKKLFRHDPDKLFTDSQWLTVDEVAIIEGVGPNSVHLRCAKKINKVNDTLRNSARRMGGLWKIDRFIYSAGYKNFADMLEQRREHFRKEKEAWKQWVNSHQS